MGDLKPQSTDNVDDESSERSVGDESSEHSVGDALGEIGDEVERALERAVALATASDKGFTEFRQASGTFTTCTCMAKWLPVAEQLGLARGLIKHNLDIIQLTGKAQKSAGVHMRGGAFDVVQRTDAWVSLFREMGAPASWRRATGVFIDGPHLHGVLSGCPHNGPAAYQVTAQKDGFDGLGFRGHGSRDPHPDPSVRRTWKQGIAWAKDELAKLAAPPEEDIMASIEDLRKVLREELAAVPANVWAFELMNHDPNPKDNEPPRAFPARSYQVMANWRAADNQAALARVSKMLADLNGKPGVDEKALAAALVAALGPIVRKAVIESGQPEAVAAAVVSKLGSVLKPPG